jgi:hypothetical protein
VIFAPVLRLMEMEVRRQDAVVPLAYYHAHWTRRDSPLLDELGAVLDHIEAFRAGGLCSPENLCTACCKCNGRKSSAGLRDWERRKKRTAIKGKYGEPQHWDGLTSLFVVLASRNNVGLTATERRWLKAITQMSEPGTG